MSLEVYVNRTIKNCKSCTVFKSVDDDPEIEEPFALITLKAGKNILVNPNVVAWSWDDKKYYKCKVGKREGYILSALVE